MEQAIYSISGYTEIATEGQSFDSKVTNTQELWVMLGNTVCSQQSDLFSLDETG